jgi:UDP-N-acetyl-D-glucosamine dehydrogenase
MPAYTASRIGDVLNDAGKAVRGARILVMGVAYKPDVGDVRESPALRVIAKLRRRGAEIDFHDPYVETITVAGEVLTRVELTDVVLAEADCVVLLTPHRVYDLNRIASLATRIFDSHDAYGPDGRPANVVRL